MKKFTVSEEEIFFGIVAGDGTRTSIIRKQPSRAELEQLWQEYHDLFAGQCECGATNYIYSHIITRRRIFRCVKTSVVASLPRVWQKVNPGGKLSEGAEKGGGAGPAGA